MALEALSVRTQEALTTSSPLQAASCTSWKRGATRRDRRARGIGRSRGRRVGGGGKSQRGARGVAEFLVRAGPRPADVFVFVLRIES